MLATSQARIASLPSWLDILRLPRLTSPCREASQCSASIASSSFLPELFPFLQSHLAVSLSLSESALMDLFICVDKKGLTEKLSFLESTLTKNIEGGVVIVN